ncbi:MAG: DUF4919 domain-containing protein [Rikenellaceae bacterium]
MKLRIINFKKFFILTTTLAVSVFTIGTAFSASTDKYLIPDYDKINIEIHTNSSDNFYPKIFERYMKGDTTLTLENYHHLYYGYSFNEGYSPIEVNPMKDSLMFVMERNQDKNLISPEIFDDMEKVAIKSLAYNPFDISVLNMLTFINEMKGDVEKAMEYSHKVKMIKETIFASGSGFSRHNPYHVISRDEEEAIMASLGVEYVKRMYVSVNEEYFMFKNRYLGAKGIYFNIGRMWVAAPQERKKPDKRFEFNPYQNPKSTRYVKPT